MVKKHGKLTSSYTFSTLIKVVLFCKLLCMNYSISRSLTYCTISSSNSCRTGKTKHVLKKKIVLITLIRTESICPQHSNRYLNNECNFVILITSMKNPSTFRLSQSKQIYLYTFQFCCKSAFVVQGTNNKF